MERKIGVGDSAAGRGFDIALVLVGKLIGTVLEIPRGVATG
jgi:hypothetical protein